MGQQQLLLLVLATVIVGLATVAGIQAFSENQAQASQDALVQRGTSIASDIQGLASKPSQLGGVSLGAGDNTTAASPSDIINKLGYQTTENSNTTVPADGAGQGGTCEITSTGGGSADIECTSRDAPQTVTVTVTPANDEPISTSFSS